MHSYRCGRNTCFICSTCSFDKYLELFPDTDTEHIENLKINQTVTQIWTTLKRDLDGIACNISQSDLELITGDLGFRLKSYRLRRKKETW